MDTAAILHTIADEIECDLHNHRAAEQSASFPATISTWVAAALLQKAIRRGRTDLALAAAQVLYASAPGRLWRRLVVIAVEDIGLGDLPAVYTSVSAAAHRRRLARRVGEWRLISLVVTRLASVLKCRAGDDLAVATNDCPAWNEDRLELAGSGVSGLLAEIASNNSIERRAIATSLVMAPGTSMSNGGSLDKRQGRPQAVFDLLCDIAPHTLVEISREAYRQTREPFCAFLPLLYQYFDGAEAELQSDALPPETIVGGIPGWALDGFSREGRSALSQFLLMECATANWLRLHVPPRDRAAMLRHAQFRTEAGLKRIVLSGRRVPVFVGRPIYNRGRSRRMTPPCC